MLAIPGTGDLGHLEQNVAAAALRLTEDDLAALAGLRLRIQPDPFSVPAAAE